MQASEFQHVRWPSNHSRHSSGGFSTGEALKGEPRARTPTGQSRTFLLWPCNCKDQKNKRNIGVLPFFDFAGYQASALAFLSGTNCQRVAHAVHTMAKELLMQYKQWTNSCSCGPHECHWLKFNLFCGVGGPMRRIEMLKTSSFRSDLSSSSLSPSVADSAMTHQRTSGDNHSPANSRRNSSMQVASPLGPRPDRQVSCTPTAHLLLVSPRYRLHARLHGAMTSGIRCCCTCKAIFWSCIISSLCYRGILTRPQLAMCLLAEVAYEHDEDFCSHLPLLFHAIMIAMDSPEPLVYHHAQQALVNLLYSLSARHLELHKNSGALLTEHHQVTSLIKYLQSMRSRRLWAYEDITLRHTYLASSTALAALVNAVTEAIFFESDLRERWAAEALKWMLGCNSRHLACRSHQVCMATHPQIFWEWLASKV